MSRERTHDQRDVLIDTIAEEMGLSTEIVEKVISWSYMEANKAVKDKKEIEVSGLGKFFVSKSKLSKRIKTLESRLVDTDNENTIRTTTAELEYIKTKLNEQSNGVSSSDTERIEESKISS